MTWSPDPHAFLRDIEAKPSALRALADVLSEGDPWRSVRGARRVVLLGMGSSRFASLPIADRLRAMGVDAVAEYASASSAHPGGEGTLAVGISASGATEETVDALRRHRDVGSSTVALTNASGSPLEAVAGLHIPMRAGDETGGVACRSFQHTLALLVALWAPDRVVDAVRGVADATEDLLERRDDWIPAALDVVGSAGPVFLITPAARESSADQGALMFREGPRVVADACEAGDWLHVDVYLTKPLDYRAIVFGGSAYDEPIMTWMRERGGRVLAVGADVTGAAATVRYQSDDDPEVALLTEVAVPELLAATIWARQA